MPVLRAGPVPSSGLVQSGVRTRDVVSTPAPGKVSGGRVRKHIIGFVSRLDPEVIRPWVASARVSVPDAVVTLFADDVKYNVFQPYGVHVVQRTDLWTNQ